MSVSSLIDVKEQLLIVPSIWTKLMTNLFSRIAQLFVLDFNAFFVTLTDDSQVPTIHGLLGGMKYHCISRIDKLLAFVIWSKFFTKNYKSRFAPTKFWPLSLLMLLGLPRLEVNLCSTIIKELVLKLPAIFSCVVL